METLTRKPGLRRTQSEVRLPQSWIGRAASGESAGSESRELATIMWSTAVIRLSAGE